ncbi:UDP-2,3-diacylglucosamine diphosphatase [Chitinibacter sp. S2-10]|uniref:UDP-2,3-diacylglucosamine diphosphatase n=1 Tax=Chitinibacter sp. S2-10 TaxID=3373597 RepID=UPI003977DB78
MTRPTLFISDLHLSPADPATVAAFRAFLHTTASHAAALYILGDLFEYWLGDDQLDDEFYGDLAHEIAALKQHDVAVYFMAGNRDFLPGSRFARQAKLQIINDPTLLTLNGLQLVLAHGDAYCTEDVGYQRWRKISRNRLFQWIWLNLPRRIRSKEADKIRARSKTMNQHKPKAIMDVTEAAIAAEFAKYPSSVLIHGHTHKPFTHQYPYGQRWVLPDWHHGQGGYLQIIEQHMSLHQLDGSAWQTH